MVAHRLKDTLENLGNMVAQDDRCKTDNSREVVDAFYSLSNIRIMLTSLGCIFCQR